MVRASDIKVDGFLTMPFCQLLYTSQSGLRLLAEVAGAEAASLRLLRTALVGAEPTPLLAVELLPDAIRHAHHVTFLQGRYET